MGENPHEYWCRPCGRSREHAERWCSSAYCKERRDEEVRLRDQPDRIYIHLWESSL